MALLCLAKSFEMISSYTGLGPGGLTIKEKKTVLQKCIVGSSHGGHAGSSESNNLKTGQPYDKENLTSLLGGSGGELMLFLSFACFSFELVSCM